MKRLLVVRHGNTFNAGDTLLRVGGGTDLSLSTEGQAQALQLGLYLQELQLVPDVIYTSALKRTQETAKLAIESINRTDINIIPNEKFNEIHYGDDEGKPEVEVKARLKDQLIAWERDAIVPMGWQANPEEIIATWKEFADNFLDDNNSLVMVVTSNGMARFAPFITNDYQTFKEQHNIKLKTAAFGSLVYNNGTWQVEFWNKRAS